MPESRPNRVFLLCACTFLLIAGTWSLVDADPMGRRAAGEAAKGQRVMSDAATTEQKAEPRHTNRLIHATSPYLLQHAHNPVDWYQWGPEALRKAKEENKPIFLSIGYSACHWCHVMERESFENEDVAAVMNEHYVCIKVDREERPDLDDIYMAATQAFSGSGGWPMSVWLTPDLEPFYAGTYFPPTSRYGRPGFKELLLHLAGLWERDRATVVKQADTIMEAVRRLTTVEPGDEVVPHSVVLRAAGQIARAFDSVKGGLRSGGTNKFPPSMAMDLMLRAYHHSITDADGEAGAQRRLLEMVELTLEKMAHGGIYDHLGGGFARYSTDADWLVPHFEKMLYDQALISDIYMKAYQLTKKPLYAEVARETLDYVIADLQGPEGGFYSSRDADSEGEEGRFYVWTRDQVVEILGDDEAALFCDTYDVSASGNWEGHNILNVPRPREAVAKMHKIGVEDLLKRLSASRAKLLAARAKRVAPHLDDKILASWNGLMIASMARGYRVLGDTRYREAATRAADFVLSQMVVKGRLQRTYRAGTTHTPAYLDDHAFMIEALLNLYETTFEERWLDQACALNDQVLRYFRDERDGGFFFTANDAERVLVRAKDANDGAIPSGNSVQLMNLLRLSVLLGRKDLAAEADRVIRAFSKSLRASPYRSERMLAALDFRHRRPREIAFVGTEDVSKLEPLINAAWGAYVPNVVFARSILSGSAAESLGRKIPLLAGKKPLGSGIAAYVCRDFACKAPTDDPQRLVEQIRR